MKNQTSLNANVVVAFIVGAAAGIAAGILMAPDKGTATRDRLLKKAKDLDLSQINLESLGLKDLADRVTGRAESLKNDVSSHVQNM